MMADTTLYSKYDIAALMALINMLKVSLIDQPEVYKTLLAMMCDFDPREANLRNKVKEMGRQNLYCVRCNFMDKYTLVFSLTDWIQGYCVPHVVNRLEID